MKYVSFMTAIMAFLGLFMVLATPVPSPMMPGESSSSRSHQSSNNPSRDDSVPDVLTVNMHQPRHLIMTTASSFSEKLAALMAANTWYNHRIHIIPTGVQDVEGAIQDHHHMIQNSALDEHQKNKFRYYTDDSSPHAKRHEIYFVSQVPDSGPAEMMPLSHLGHALQPAVPVHIHVMSKPVPGLLKRIFQTTSNSGVVPELLFHPLRSVTDQRNSQAIVDKANRLTAWARSNGTKEVVWVGKDHSWARRYQGHHKSIASSLVSPDVPPLHLWGGIFENRSLEKIVGDIEDFFAHHPRLQIGLRLQTIVPQDLNMSRDEYLRPIRTKPQNRAFRIDVAQRREHLLQWLSERRNRLRIAARGRYPSLTGAERRKAGRLYYLLEHEVSRILNQSGPHVQMNHAFNAAALYHAINNNPRNDLLEGARLEKVAFVPNDDGNISIHPQPNSRHKMIVGAKFADARTHYIELMGPSRARARAL